jgi:hypothetical protein
MPSAASIKRQKELLERRNKLTRTFDKRVLALRFLAERVGKKRIKELDEQKKLIEFLELKSTISRTGATSRGKVDTFMGAGMRELQPAIIDAIKEIRDKKQAFPYSGTTSRALSMLEAAGIVETEKAHHQPHRTKITIKDHKRLDNTLKKRKDGYYYIDWGKKLKK